MPKILVAEDEVAIARLLELELRREGFEADIFYDGAAALKAAQSGAYDLALMDIMMPEKNGLEVLRDIRAFDSDLPIIMLTAKGELEDKVLALGLGADDYIVKPFAMQEVTARIRVALRRSTPKVVSNILQNGALCVNKDTCSVHYGEQAVELTKKEYELVLYFMEHIGRVCSREDIIRDVWGFDYIGDTNLIDVYIRYLRSKIDNVFGTCYFKTVRGFGYIMEEAEHAEK